MRLWCIQVSMPDIPTIIAAAMPISNKINADKLFSLLKVLLDGLLAKGLNIIAYAADGSTVERGVQNMLDHSCESRKILTQNQGSPISQSRFLSTVHKGRP